MTGPTGVDPGRGDAAGADLVGDPRGQGAAAYRAPGPGEGLASVLPAALVALGAGVPPGVVPPGWELPDARRIVVVLVDGLGARQLARRSGHARVLRDLSSPVEGTFRCGFPSTTATSLTSLGTGRPAGEHGIIGWQTCWRGELFNHLAWRDGPDPGAHQPLPTMLQEAARRDITVSTVSRTMFAGSGFTRAALRGGGFVGAESAAERLDGVLGVLGQVGRRGRALVYAYWDEVDKAGHVHGPESLEWGEAVEAVDAFVGALLDRAPEGTLVVVTSDHGMVEAPFTQRRDLAHDPVLDAGVRLLAGEPRAPQVWCEPGAAVDVVGTWRAELGEGAIVLTRDEAVEAGWFGPLAPGRAERVGDVVVAMLGGSTVLDSRLLRPEVLRLLGHHGSVTDAETAIPLLVGRAGG